MPDALSEFSCLSHTLGTGTETHFASQLYPHVYPNVSAGPTLLIPQTSIHLIVCLFIGRFSRDGPRTPLHNSRRFHR
jgi:hypothetical protein